MFLRWVTYDVFKRQETAHSCPSMMIYETAAFFINANNIEAETTATGTKTTATGTNSLFSIFKKQDESGTGPSVKVELRTHCCSEISNFIIVGQPLSYCGGKYHQ